MPLQKISLSHSNMSLFLCWAFVVISAAVAAAADDDDAVAAAVNDDVSTDVAFDSVAVALI